MTSLPTGWEATTDLARIDLVTVHRWLSLDAYWALGRSLEQIRTAAEHSVNVGVLDEAGQLRGYARLVTDRVSFTWLCDVYADPSARGQGVGKALVAEVVALVDSWGTRRTLLATQDAHGLYAAAGFEVLNDPERWMRRWGPGQAPAS